MMSNGGGTLYIGLLSMAYVDLGIGLWSDYGIALHLFYATPALN